MPSRCTNASFSIGTAKKSETQPSCTSFDDLGTSRPISQSIRNRLYPRSTRSCFVALVSPLIRGGPASGQPSISFDSKMTIGRYCRKRIGQPRRTCSSWPSTSIFWRPAPRGLRPPTRAGANKQAYRAARTSWARPQPPWRCSPRHRCRRMLRCRRNRWPRTAPPRNSSIGSRSRRE
jgi:hypothetical protein